MADRERENNLDDEDRGVKIEIHDEDDPAEETPDKKEEGAGETEQTEKKEPQETDSAAESGDSGSDAAPEEGEKKDAADPDGKNPGKEDGKGSSDDSGDAKDSGKSFFGFKNKKDKKDEKIEELTDRVRRQMAEFDNFRKRTDREKAVMFDMGKKDVIEKILPVVDSFERGLGDQEEESADPFRQGMQKIYRQLTKALEELGVKPIDAVGKPFDPNFHNAVMHCEDDSVGENTIVQELQKGYMLNDTVIRHSMVKVAN